MKDEIEDIAGGEIQEFVNSKVPKFLKYVYFILPIWGFFWFYMYWNGSQGALDRGGWSQLEQAAQTKAPFKAKP